MIVKIKQSIYNDNVFTAVLTDLYEAFESINHEFLIAKLNTCSFSSLLLGFIFANLNFREKKAKFGSTLSDYLNILFGFLQVFIAEPLFLMFVHAIYFCI